ncbi:MAG: Gfo/Idh/MocA family oxidoreductase [Chloroflexi bacterium]|nr:Gfo/Idh/MocA family oxidoreductase [Chloroflexota bacterium]
MSDKLRVGVVGTGFGTTVQVPGFQAHPDYEVVAICSANLGRAQAAAEKAGVPHAFNDLQQMLELPGLDIVSITSPPATHLPMTAAALAAGKHVLCEKPMAMNLGEAREMERLAAASGKVCMIDFEFHFIPARARFKELVDEGYLGAPTYLNVSAINGPRGDIATARAWNWWSQEELGGGYLQAVGSHFIDALQWWFGDISEVSADLHHATDQRLDPATNEMRPVTTEDSFLIQFRLASGAPGALLGSSVGRFGQGNRVEAYGTEGTLIITPELKLLGGRRGESGLTELEIPDRLQAPAHLPSNLRFFYSLIGHYAEAVRSGDTSVQPGFDAGRRTQEVLDAIRQSASTRAAVRLPLAE